MPKGPEREGKALYDFEVDEDPVINLPEDSSWRELLRDKLAQYDRWQAKQVKALGSEFPSATPASVEIFVQTMPKGYSGVILKRLLSDEEVDARALAQELMESQGDNFNRVNFNHGYRLIGEYSSHRPTLQRSVDKFNNKYNE